mmetsp:Transcript_6758/g.21139  ORF Transcript_6758/g.21139 Transcript_6758/m.21139 type:complete len:93 (-) Transcript_6758:395-673(-)
MYFSEDGHHPALVDQGQLDKWFAEISLGGDYNSEDSPGVRDSARGAGGGADKDLVGLPSSLKFAACGGAPASKIDVVVRCHTRPSYPHDPAW